MKKIPVRATAWALALLLAAGPAPSASPALGTDLHTALSANLSSYTMRLRRPAPRALFRVQPQ